MLQYITGHEGSGPDCRPQYLCLPGRASSTGSRPACTVHHVHPLLHPPVTFTMVRLGLPGQTPGASSSPTVNMDDPCKPGIAAVSGPNPSLYFRHSEPLTKVFMHYRN